MLKKHDCVIVPDFGGFVGGYQSAEIDYAKGVIYPPSKRLLFNPNLTSNDGLLGNQVAKSEEISYEESLNNIETTIDEWSKTLKEGGRIEIGELGFLYNQDDKFAFEQSREINLLLAAYGLSPVKIVKKAEEKVLTTERAKISKPTIKVPETTEPEEEVHSESISGEEEVLERTEEDLKN